jgi:peptide/nickel transport system substrate-binding protein
VTLVLRRARPGAGGRQRNAWVFLALLLGLAVSSVALPRVDATSAESGGTVRVALADAPWAEFDPQASYTAQQWEILTCCLQRTLMAYPGFPGAVGAHAVPDLAVAPPQVTADGRTWTFTLRSGIHYAPPFDQVEVTAGDIVRALERTKYVDGPGRTYLGIVEGYSAFAHGTADSIAGVVAVDPHTLRLTEVDPDPSIVDLMALPFSAPIPPGTAEQAGGLGVATGLSLRPDPRGYARPFLIPGYGPRQVSTGPYMIEGAANLDPSRPLAAQPVPPGIDSPHAFGRQGHLTLVRNPAWNAADDPLRPAIPDRIEATILPPDPYGGLLADTYDVVLGSNPSVGELAQYQSSALRDRVHRAQAPSTHMVTMNLAQPPFDDVRVRRAFALALDRNIVREGVVRQAGQVGIGPLTDHVVPSSMVDDLLVGWHPSALPSSPNLAAARTWMRRSKYWQGGHCVGAACRPVLVGGNLAPIALQEMATALRRIGLHPVIDNTQPPPCLDIRTHFGVCLSGWQTDFPNTAGIFSEFLSGLGGGDQVSFTGLGATPDQLRAVGLPGLTVPSVDDDYNRCAAQLPSLASLCWARLDQWLTDKLVVVVPIDNAVVVRVAGRRVTALSIDQWTGEPALNRIAVSPGS